jgi:hypothetical protein
MEELIIKKTEETPAIILNPKKKIFQFVATSWPENAKDFYEPIYIWIDNYFSNTPLNSSVFQFRYNYINTASSKQIARILTLLKSYSPKHNIIIQWFYEKGDFDMQKEGKRFAQILELNIHFVEK